MPFRDLLKKKDKEQSSTSHPETPTDLTQVDTHVESNPTFTFIRSDTNTEEIITPPSYPDNDLNEGKKLLHLFGRRSRSGSTASIASQKSTKSAKSNKSAERPDRRLSERLGLHKETTSAAVPQDLPAIGKEDGEQAESQWEQRATILARENQKSRSRDVTPDPPARISLEKGESGIVASKNTDDNIQEAIRLHEAGQLEEATRMFGRLADPSGENNALSQVLYGLALRHGWGCKADPEKAMTYLSAAASNAASVEDIALQAGAKKGGAAKGELVLAIFELANSFRHGWGVKKDPVAAKQYYETAANLGDTDAMNEVAWCYLEGFGCKKDKFASAKYYRLAENGGNKTLGNTWIWKPKYDPPANAMSSDKK